MVNVITWILFGALAGWVASLLLRTNEKQTYNKNVMVGIVGALLSGMGVYVLYKGMTLAAFNPGTLPVTVGGSVSLVIVYKMLRGAY